MKSIVLATLITILIPFSVFSQVVTSIPAFPTIEDSVVVIFNANEGDGGLKGFTGEVYAHTGVITSKSVDSADWKFVIGSWGDNDIQPQLANLGGDLWQLTVGDIRSFYGIPLTEKVLQLAFVFRSADAQKTGRDVGGPDIFLDIIDTEFKAGIVAPVVDTRFGDLQRSPVFTHLGSSVEIVAAKVPDAPTGLMMSLLVEGQEVASTTEDTLRVDFVAVDFGTGFHKISFVVADTTGPADTTHFLIMVNPDIVEAARPDGIIDGINKIDNSTVTLSLFAPFKDFIYVIGDFNDWKVHPDFLMNRDVIRQDSVHYWLSLEGLNPDAQYAFQYLVDGKTRIADPYTGLILTPADDKFIGEALFPNLKPYPVGITAHNVSTFQINENKYQWQVSDFQRPAKEELLIYELLIRDFIAAHNYATMIDTLDYLQRLGINAIELMPVNEFEGNESWGYNPAFYFAPDKYYGPPNDLRRFIDECHKRGIAVILDSVLNHSFGQSSLVRLYSAGEFGPPTPENPWYNVTARHPFSVGFDFNHESPVTKSFVDRVNEFWLTEYKVDGFRFDLSKGFTQQNSGSNVSLWSSFDASRIALLTRMANKMWQVDSTAYVILEHFADNNEEKVLSARGMMLWGNMNTAYSQSAMGWLSDPIRSSDFSGAYYKNRGWTKPHLISYMESHDEPWIMYKNIQFGRSSADGSYNVKELLTALNRVKLVAAFFFTLPGPKMMWQFGELGYEQELPESGFERTAPKPILWQYNEDEDRKRLYKFISELLKLRQSVEVFRSPQTSVTMQVAQSLAFRKIVLSHPSTNVLIIGNFNVNPMQVNPGFTHEGVWYDYFFQDSVSVDNNFGLLALKPGEFHLYTDKFVGFPEEILITDVESKNDLGSVPGQYKLFQNYPNPFNPTTTIEFNLPIAAEVKIDVYNLTGQKVKTLSDEFLNAGNYAINWNGLDDNNLDTASGLYFIKMHSRNYSKSIKIIKLK